MLLALAFMLPAIAVLACLGLNRFIPTRWCAFGAALGLALAALSLLAQRSMGQPMQLLDLPWFDLSDRTIHLMLQLDHTSWPIALTLLAGGGVLLAAVGFALPPSLRGFGGLPAILVLVVLTTLVGIANHDPIIRPIGWMLVVLSCAMAIRASGTPPDSDAPLIVALAGTVATILLLATGLLIRPGLPISNMGLLCMLIASLLMLAVAPFTAVARATSEAPAGIGASLVALGLPLIGGHTLLAITAEVGLPAQWRTALILIGLVSVLASGAGALGTYQARPLLAWQHSAQLGVFLIAVGAGGPAIGLLLCATLSTLAGALAIALLERRAGTDDLSTALLPDPLSIPGLALLIAAATAVGLPGTGGFWMRAQLFSLLTQQGLSWVIGILLAGGLLLGLSYLAPLAIFWRARSVGQPEPAPFRLAYLLPILVVVPLLTFGVVPQLLDPGAPQPSLLSMVASVAAILVLIAVPVLLLQFPWRAPLTSDEQSGGAVLPVAMATSLRGLAWLAAPTGALNIGWEALLQGSLLLARLLARVEERYYLAGLTIALIVVVLVFI